MNKIRLLPVVILAVAALLVFKTIGLVTGGGYVLTGVSVAQAAGGGGGGHAALAAEPGEVVTLPSEPTIEDATPTMGDTAPTMGEAEAGGHGSPAATGHGEAPAEDHGAPAGDEAEAPHGTEDATVADGAHGEPANVVEAANACDPQPVAVEGEEPSAEGELVVIAADCPPLADGVPQLVTAEGLVPLNAGDATLTEQTLLERLSTRRTELETYEQELAMRASLVEAAEQRIAERQQTLQSIEDQIAALVEERKQMEEGQFASIVAMYETMKPKDAANIFNALDIEVLFRVAKIMSPRKMSPILAEMNTARAQELTVRLASAGADPLESMTPDDLAALPQIVGQ